LTRSNHISSPGFVEHWLERLHQSGLNEGVSDVKNQGAVAWGRGVVGCGWNRSKAESRADYEGNADKRSKTHLGNLSAWFWLVTTDL